MISRNDLLLLLTQLENDGIDTSQPTKELLRSNEIPLSVIKFINDNRQLDLTSFYENLRKNYNKKKSPLYKNIVKEIDEVQSVLTTLASLSLQILLYSKQVDNREMFLKHSRFSEIEKVLYNYSKTFDLKECIKLLRLIKADIKALESIRPTNNANIE